MYVKCQYHHIPPPLHSKSDMRFDTEKAPKIHIDKSKNVARKQHNIQTASPDRYPQSTPKNKNQPQEPPFSSVVVVASETKPESGPYSSSKSSGSVRMSTKHQSSPVQLSPAQTGGKKKRARSRANSPTTVSISHWPFGIVQRFPLSVASAVAAAVASILGGESSTSINHVSGRAIDLER